jgi:hypothetical protein
MEILSVPQNVDRNTVRPTADWPHPGEAEENCDFRITAANATVLAGIHPLCMRNIPG